MECKLDIPVIFQGSFGARRAGLGSVLENAEVSFLAHVFDCQSEFLVFLGSNSATETCVHLIEGWSRLEENRRWCKHWVTLLLFGASSGSLLSSWCTLARGIHRNIEQCCCCWLAALALLWGWNFLSQVNRLEKMQSAK